MQQDMNQGEFNEFEKKKQKYKSMKISHNFNQIQ